MPAPPPIATLGALKDAVASGRIPRRRVRDEVRDNLRRRLKARAPLFPGIVGYDETVVPQIVNAVLARHHFILLGLRGQAKTRLLRLLTDLLDDYVPVVPGSEINDDPLAPLSAYAQARIAEEGDDMPVDWLPRERRFVEKLATPDVTIADLIGDIDPIKAARSGLELGNELTMHYGLLPRANRGLFAVNELPDLAGKIQVGLFNILQEGDVQIKGYPVRLALDVMMVFTANPEDYTARGKIITPLKDRIGAEIRTHYLSSRAAAASITAQEAWTSRGDALEIPAFVRDVVEEVAFEARDDRRIDKRSGVSQRMPIAVLETAVSNAERRAWQHDEALPVVRVTDVRAALPSMTGRFELEYEGELKGAEAIARDIVRTAVGRVLDGYLPDADPRLVVDWFDGGGSVALEDGASADAVLAEGRRVPGLLDLVTRVGIPPDAAPSLLAAGVDFVLEGLAAQKHITRSDDGAYRGGEPVNRPSRPGPRAPVLTPDDDDDDDGNGGGSPGRGRKKRYYN